MAERNQNNSDTSDRELSISRLVNAPRELVWEVWTKPEHIAKWWGPNGFTNTISTMDVKPGGIWELVMHGPDGTDYSNKSTYKEIVKPERIVFEHVSNPKFLTTVNFIAEGNKTRINWHMLFESKEQFEYVVRNHKADQGLSQNIDKLETYLSANFVENGFSITRIIDAPQKLIFTAFSEAAHLSQWWHPGGFTTQVAAFDFRVGGIFHYCMRSPDGFVLWGRIVYREIEPPVRIVFVNSPSDETGRVVPAAHNPALPIEVLNELSFSEQDGKTTLVLRSWPINATVEQIRAFTGPYLATYQQVIMQTHDELDKYLALISK